jgi:hypothetical protein
MHSADTLIHSDCDDTVNFNTIQTYKLHFNFNKESFKLIYFIIPVLFTFCDKCCTQKASSSHASAGYAA